MFTSVCLIITVVIRTFGQINDNYQHYKLTHPTLGTIEYHVDTVNYSAKQPVLLWLDGSGCLPLRMVITDGKNCCLFHKSLMIDDDSLARYYHIVLISKPGISYQADTVHIADYDRFNFNEFIEAHYSGKQCGAVFNQYNSLGWRAGAASVVLNEVLKRVPADRRRIIVAGHSEGAPVAAKTATLNRHITHVGCFAGPSLTQFYDFVLAARKKALAEQITPEAAQHQIDTVLAVTRAIMANSMATDQFWEGNTYKRWASYAQPPADDLLTLTIPIYVAIGTNDENTAAENADILPILFAQKQKDNLTYRACPSCDHWLVDTRTKENRWKRYFDEFLQRTQHGVQTR